jgi:hypothetical protein
MEILGYVPWWIWLLVSIVPYSIKRRKTPDMQSLVLSALFWQFSFTYQKRQYSWSFSLPWIKLMQSKHCLRKLFASAWAKFVHEIIKKIITL